jgi:hypothetical protein
MEYEQLKLKIKEAFKKHNLNFEEIDNEFEIADTFYSKRTNDHFLRNTRRVIVDMLFSYINYLHNFIAPNSQSVILMQESEFFTDSEKDEIDEIMKKIMLINRSSLNMELEKNEAKDAEFITKTISEWKTIRPAIIKITNTLVDNWKKNI